MGLSAPRLLGGPYVMGIVNVTPDSFSDGGSFPTLGAAMDHACRLWEAGADLIDIGGESTRPGAVSVSESEEIDRIAPLIEALATRIPAVLSIDTMKPAVARVAAQAGARFWNDVAALTAPLAPITAAALGLHILLMHKRGAPSTMQHAPQYKNVVEEVIDFLRERTRVAEAAGVARAKIWIDPGIGFGKTLAHNAALLRATGTIIDRVGLPLCIGISRKSFIAGLEEAEGATPSSSDARLGGSLAGALFSMAQGARMLRVHDVAQTVQALRVMRFLSAPADGHSAY